MRGILVRIRDPNLILFLTSNQIFKLPEVVLLSCPYGMVPWAMDPDAWRLA